MPNATSVETFGSGGGFFVSETHMPVVAADRTTRHMPFPVLPCMLAVTV